MAENDEKVPQRNWARVTQLMFGMRGQVTEQQGMLDELINAWRETRLEIQETVRLANKG